MVLASIEQFSPRSTIVLTRSVGHRTAVEQLRMLDAVDAGGDGDAQPLDARRVRFGGAVALVRLLDDHLLRLGREPDERRL